MSSGAEELAAFARALRAEGLAVGTDRVLSFCRAATLVDLYWAGRATLVSTPAEIEVYDRLFAAFFGGVQRPSVTIEGEIALEVARASTEEVLRDQPAAAEPASLHVAVPPRRTRRRRRARRGMLDVGGTLRRSFRTDGDPVARVWRARRHEPRRLVLLLDVSGSMADYSRDLLRSATAVLRDDRRHEAFAFGTRLTRLGDADVIPDWGGGTRIGETLDTFVREHGNLARGSIVVICSDGLDAGDPELVAAGMARLARLAHRVVWLNPLASDPRYEPLARAMEAALPYVDVFAAWTDLTELVLAGDALLR